MSMHNDHNDFILISKSTETQCASLGLAVGAGDLPQYDPERVVCRKVVVIQSKLNERRYTYSYIHRFDGGEGLCDPIRLHETHVYFGVRGDTLLEYPGYVSLHKCMSQIPV